MSTALEREKTYSIRSFDDIQRVAMAMSKSGFFQDTREVAQAIVKIMAGREMGLGPFASMTGIHVIKGQPVLGANLIATLIKNDPRYDYHVDKLEDDVCEISFLEDGEVVGTVTFTIEDAKRAGVGQAVPPGKPAPMLELYPKNMLFARAISNGAKWYIPGVFGGAPVYTPDEFDLEVDEQGDVIEGQITDYRPPDIPTKEFFARLDELADAHGWEHEIVRQRADAILQENGGSRVDALETIERKIKENGSS